MNTKKIVLLIGAVVILGVAYYGLSPLWRTSTLIEPFPTPLSTAQNEASATSSAPQVLATASFINTPTHPGSGSVSLIQAGEQRIIRFEQFKTINGPDLFVYLSTDTKASDFITLGTLKATAGDFNYAVPPGTDLTKYRYVLVWCEAFGVLFNSANITVK